MSMVYSIVLLIFSTLISHCSLSNPLQVGTSFIECDSVLNEVKCGLQAVKGDIGRGAILIALLPIY